MAKLEKNVFGETLPPQKILLCSLQNCLFNSLVDVPTLT